MSKNVILNLSVCFVFVCFINFAGQMCLFKGKINEIGFLHQIYSVGGAELPGVRTGVLYQNDNVTGMSQFTSLQCRC